MRRVVVVVLDGMRRDLLDEAHTPALARFASRSRGFYRPPLHVSVGHARGLGVVRDRLHARAPRAGGIRWRCWRTGGSSITMRAIPIPAAQATRDGPIARRATLAERLAPHGGMIMFSNVSPGAAYAHDPDGHGHVYHRAGSFAPGRKRLEGAQGLGIAQDAAGERAMTSRFIDEVLVARKPALGDPVDGRARRHAAHRPLGSPEHLAVLRQADANAAR